MPYSSMAGKEIHPHLILQTERGQRRVLNLTGNFKDRISYLMSGIREAADNLIEEGLHVTREKKTELLEAIEEGKKAMEEDKKDWNSFV